MAKKHPTRVRIKKALAQMERDRLISLVEDLYTLGRENGAFIEARLGLMRILSFPSRGGSRMPFIQTLSVGSPSGSPPRAKR